MVKVYITAEAIEHKLKRAALYERGSFSRRQLRALLELAERAGNPLIAKLDRVRKVSHEYMAALTREEIRLLLTLALEALRRQSPSPV